MFSFAWVADYPDPDSFLPAPVPLAVAPAGEAVGENVPYIGDATLVLEGRHH